MQTTITGRHIGIDDRFRVRIEERLEAAAGKFFASAIEAQAVFTKEAHAVRTDLTIHVGHGMSFQSHGEAGDAAASFTAAVERLEKRMRRDKRKRRDHHKEAREAHALEESGTLAPSAD